MSEKKVKIIERSVNSLQWFYTIILSLAVVHSVQKVVAIVDSQPVINYKFIHNFISFIIIIIPFHQGANRYLDETYLHDTSKKINEFSGLVDFLFFVIEGIGFYIMAIFIGHDIYFYIMVTIVLAIDVIWLGFVYFVNRGLFKKIKSWMIINTIMITILLIFLALKNIFHENLKWYLLTFFIVLRTIFDYRFSWPFYWHLTESENEEK